MTKHTPEGYARRSACLLAVMMVFGIPHQHTAFARKQALSDAEFEVASFENDMIHRAEREGRKLSAFGHKAHVRDWIHAWLSDPVPTPAPEAAPAPEPVSVPAPEPTPLPAPEPTPLPAPEPAPEPAPAA